jgi:hypothetical protein
MLNQRLQLQRDLDTLNARYTELMRSRMVPSSRAMIVRRKITEIERQIETLDKQASDRFALERIPIEQALEVVAIPLLADVINDVVAGVDATLRRNGVQETVFGMYTAQIRKAAMAMVDTLAVSEAGMPRLLEVNDTLVDAVKKKLMSFIKQRLNIKKS